MIKKTVIALAVALVLILTFVTRNEAQQAKKVWRIGFLAATSPSVEAARIEAFRQGLRELGYVEGKNIVIEWRWAEGKFDRLPDLAAELVRLNVDVIVTGGSTSSGAAKEVTTTIPIVMAQVNDPVGSGFVASLARPGGNMTGLSTLVPELSGKRLELLKEVIPKLSHVAVFWNPASTFQVISEKEVQTAARAFKMKVLSLGVQSPAQFDNAFATIRRERPRALLVLADRLFLHNRARIMDFATQNRLPGVHAYEELVEAGGLMSYGPSYPGMHRRAATYVDKILKGAKPADLPVEAPAKFELVINLKAAKQIWVTIPQSVLYRADKVIK